MKNSSENKIAATSIAAAGTGAALMFFFDPSRGKKRRTVVRDKAAKFVRQGTRLLAKSGRDLSRRTHGIIAETCSYVSSQGYSDDIVLSERVRSRLGRLVSHPSAITVSVKDGEATVRGDVLESELDRLLSGVSGVPGVRKLRNRLTSYETPEGVPALHGSHTDSARTRVLQAWMTPSGRMLAGLAGTGLTLYGTRKQGLFARLAGTVGLALLGGELVSIANTKSPSSHTKPKSPTSPQSTEQEPFELAAKHEEWK